MANHDSGYKLLFSHASVVADVLRGFVKSYDPEELRWAVGRMAADPQLDEGLRKSVHTWLTQVLLPARFPELSLAEARSLEEVHTMLAERVMQWTRQWKEEGRQEGREEGIRAFQDFLLSEMADRFGPVPEAVRRRVEGIQDLDELKRLGKRLLAASSLADLGL